ncbi:hypothetical protein Tco_0570627 [Tanacetum coccineum]
MPGRETVCQVLYIFGFSLLHLKDAADNPDKRQQHNTTHTSTTTDVADPPPLNIHSTHQTPTQVSTVTAPENIIQAETNTENALLSVEFIIFSTLEALHQSWIVLRYMELVDRTTMQKMSLLKVLLEKQSVMRKITVFATKISGLWLWDMLNGRIDFESHFFTSCSVGTRCRCYCVCLHINPSQLYQMEPNRAWYDGISKLPGIKDSQRIYGSNSVHKTKTWGRHLACANLVADINFCENWTETGEHLTVLNGIFRYFKTPLTGSLVVISSSVVIQKAGCHFNVSCRSEYVSLSECCATCSSTCPASGTKHIDVRLSFIKAQAKGFKYLVRRLGMRCLTPDELEVLAIEYA